MRVLFRNCIVRGGNDIRSQGVNPELLVYMEEIWGRQLEPENNSEFECLLKKKKTAKMLETSTSCQKKI